MGRVRSPKRKLILVIPVILLPAALLGTATMVNADGGNQSLIHACVNPSGLTRLVGASEKCSPSERPYHWPASGTEGGTLTVIDSGGNTVGPLVQSDAVALTVGGKRFLVGVGPGGFRNIAGSPTLFYESLSCPPGGELILSPTTVLPLLRLAGTTGYYGDTGSGVYSVVARRNYDSTRGEFGACTASLSPGPVTPARTVNLPGFTPPFSVK